VQDAVAAEYKIARTYGHLQWTKQQLARVRKYVQGSEVVYYYYCYYYYANISIIHSAATTSAEQ
jgi:hypothetical protein